MSDQIRWAQSAANCLLSEFSDSAAIDTANYHLCAFILSAAKAVLSDKSVAQRVGDLMKPERDDKPASDDFR